MNNERFAIFLTQLRDRYQDSRKKLVSVSENDLKNNEDFKTCFKIANVLMTANSTQPANETFKALVNDIDYNVDNFLNQFDVVNKSKDENKYEPTVIERQDNGLPKNQSENTESN
jgi:hypothetical protein